VSKRETINESVDCSLLFERFRKHVRIWRIDAFVVVLSGFGDFKAELFVEFKGFLIVDLHVQEDRVEAGVVLGDVVEHVLDHLGADALTTVLVETAESHDVEATD